MTSRRIFLRNSALAMVGVGTAPLWLKRALYAADAPSPRKKILVAMGACKLEALAATPSYEQ